MFVASFETLAARGNSPTLEPAASSTRTKFELNGSDSRTRVRSRGWPGGPGKRGEGGLDSLGQCPSGEARIPQSSRPSWQRSARVRAASKSSRPTIDRSESLSFSNASTPNRCAQRASTSSKSGGQISRAFRPAGAGRTTHSLRSARSASPSLALDFRRPFGRLGRHEDVPPPLHTADDGEHPRLRQSRCLGKRTDLDSVADETQEVRPHHDRRDAGALTSLREPALEFVVELDGVRHERL